MPSTFRITVTEITPPPAETALTATIPPHAPRESRIFEQTIPDLNLADFVRMVNTKPRRRRGSSKPTQA